MAINKTQVTTLVNALKTTDATTLLNACAAVTGTDKPEDVASSVVLVLQKLSQ